MVWFSESFYHQLALGKPAEYVVDLPSRISMNFWERSMLLFIIIGSQSSKSPKSEPSLLSIQGFIMQFCCPNSAVASLFTKGSCSMKVLLSLFILPKACLLLLRSPSFSAKIRWNTYSSCWSSCCSGGWSCSKLWRLCWCRSGSPFLASRYSSSCARRSSLACSSFESYQAGSCF